MATLRERPYVQFNFLVDLGTGNTNGPEAGFQEVSGIGMEVTVSEYRTGNHKENSVMKITGLNKATDVTLKRGVIGSLNLLAITAKRRRPAAGEPVYSAIQKAETGTCQQETKAAGKAKGKWYAEAHGCDGGQAEPSAPPRTSLCENEAQQEVCRQEDDDWVRDQKQREISPA